MTTRELVLYILEKAKLSKDGDKYCYLLGENLQEGLSGFGDTQDEAFKNLLDNLIEDVKNDLKIKQDN